MCVGVVVGVGDQGQIEKGTMMCSCWHWDVFGSFVQRWSVSLAPAPNPSSPLAALGTAGDRYFDRDVQCIRTFFGKKFQLSTSVRVRLGLLC
jgi:hypothetical protein